mmetsp:Transcript_23168/g.39617  ORF Transcript_23168/g.39617 Transcript_23168/m.39617 type:complete len:145 (+) Transcript_23168:259-693(+)
MIKYTLKCSAGHQFESWFANADAFDTLTAAGHVACMTCGVSEVSKAIMAPNVSTARDKDLPAPVSAPQVPAEGVSRALIEMREHVEKNATYVGGGFASEARSMHLGDVPERPIWGEANAAEAKSLIEDGVPVAPLPFIPTRKAN